MTGRLWVRPEGYGAIPQRSPECAQLIERIARRLEPCTEDIAEQLVARIIGDIPELADHHDELLAMSTPTVALVTAMTKTWTDLEAVPAPAASVAWSRSLVARHLPMDVIVRVFRSGQAGYHDIWYQELLKDCTDPVVLVEAVRACSAFIFSWVAAITRPLMEAYHAETELRRRGAEEIRSELVHRILAGGEVDVAAAGARLDYNLRLRHLAFIAWRDDTAAGEAVLDQLVTAVATTLGGRDRCMLLLREPAHHATGWLCAPQFTEQNVQALREALHDLAGHVALGTVDSGLDGFRTSHDHARRAFRVAQLLRPDAEVTVYADVAVADLLTRDVEAAQQVTRTILGPLASQDEASRRLRETLRVFFEEGQNFARAARRLNYHPNTVAYRVRRAIELTGQDGPNSQALQAAVSMSALLDGAESPADRAIA